jgi:acrylyl-CoA reductase (NADPH)
VLSCGVDEVEPTPKDPTDILVQVDYSGVNFKDALVATPRSRVRRLAHIVGGVDAAGVIVVSSDPALPVGARVAVHGGDMGVGRDGGFAQFVYTTAQLVSHLAPALSTRDAMIIGTAGFTAMESVLALEAHGLDHEGEVLVTGATGGVGSLAVALLAAKGYRPVASTGSSDEAAWLQGLGATRIIARDEISDRPDRVLGSERWSGAIDCIGGDTLHQILRSLRYGGAVAASGLIAGTDLTTTIYPFITRAVSLLGVDSVEATSATRARVWAALAEVAPSVDFDSLVDRVVTLEELPEALESIRNGETRGRILVNPTPG